jgi:sugar diacid utilization regulator
VLAIADDHSGWTSSRRRVADELSAIVALERDRTLRRSDPERELSTALARRASAEQMAPAARRCGLDLSEPVVVVVGIGPHAATVISEALAAGPSPSLLGPAVGAGDEVFAVVSTDDPASVVSSVREAVAFVAPALGPHALQVGVSDAVRGADGLHVAVDEARAAGRAADGGPHRVGGPDRLSSHGLLLAAVPDDLRRAFRKRVLGPLLEHDRRHRTDLVSTLQAYLDCSGSWSRCAARLHVHVNTLRYRIERIEELTGKDLRRLEDQTDLLLALRVT